MSKHVVGWDTETFLITTKNPIPRIVCHSFADPRGTGRGFPYVCLSERKDIIAHALEQAAQGEIELAAHNAAFDVTCVMGTYPDLIPLVFDALDHDGIRCTRRQYELAELRYRGDVPAKGTSLKDLCKKLLGEDLAKGEDTWRLRYSELDGVPVEYWPQPAFSYAYMDAKIARDIALALPFSADMYNQTRYSVAFRLMETRGLRVDAKRLREVGDELEEGLKQALRSAEHMGLLHADSSKNMKALREMVEKGYRGLGKMAPKTSPSDRHPEGQVKTDEQTLKQLPLHHPARHVLSISKKEKLLSYVKAYQGAADAGLPVRPRLNVLRNTGRTSMAAPNLQNLPREGGLREVFVARPGFVFVNADLDTAELRSLGQTCLDIVGWSNMAKLFQQDADADPHSSFAAAMMHMSPECFSRLKKEKDESALRMRQRAKAANFGFPGGMGVPTFVQNQAAQGAKFSHQEATALKMAYMAQWPEMEYYFTWVNSVVNSTREVALPRSGRVRGLVSFCDGANTGFQGRTADVAKTWCYLVQREAFCQTSSPLHGGGLVNFIHDEIIFEAPEGQGHEAAARVEELAKAAGAAHLPDVPTSSVASLVSRWYKGPEPAYDEQGRLKPWSPGR